LSRPEDISSRQSPDSSDSTSEESSRILQHNRPVTQPSNGCAEPSAQQPDSRSAVSDGKRARLLAESEQESRRLAKGHYENFLVASILLPRRLRQPFYNVYAFCRTADDLADESETPELALERLGGFQQQFDGVFAGRPSEGLFLALADTVSRFNLSKQPFDDLLDAFRQDQKIFRYDSFTEVLDYCRRSANPVGRIVLALASSCDERNAELSDSICTGLQLVNFLQDVADDYKRGRIYVPAEEMRRFGVQESMFETKQTNAEMRELFSSECDRAEKLLKGGLPLAEHVPRWFAADVRLFAHGGLEMVKAIRAIDFDLLRLRPTVSRWTQMSLLLRASLRIL
jgi:squalene synthase HpnC